MDDGLEGVQAARRRPPLGSDDNPVVELSDVVTLLNRFPALAGIDLRVSEGEIVLLQGPNGAGKSSLLRLCAGLAPLSSGSGRVLGFDLENRRHRRDLRRQTGLLAHATFLYNELTVEENLRFWARANKVDTATVEPVLDRLALSGRLRHVKVGNLSAGQRRRTSLAVLVVRRPRLWLLDEPHAGLDANGRVFVDDLIQHAITFGATVLVASHDLGRTEHVATRVVTIVGGRIADDQRRTDPAVTTTPTAATTSAATTPAGRPGPAAPGAPSISAGAAGPSTSAGGPSISAAVPGAVADAPSSTYRSPLDRYQSAVGGPGAPTGSAPGGGSDRDGSDDAGANGAEPPAVDEPVTDETGDTSRPVDGPRYKGAPLPRLGRRPDADGDADRPTGSMFGPR